MFTDLLAKDVMSSPVITLDRHETSAAAWELLRGQPFGHLVIVDVDTVVGVIDARKLLAATPPSEMLAHGMRPVLRLLDIGTVCVTGNTSIPVVVRVMAQYRCDAVPVISAAGHPVGIITATDVIEALANALSTAHDTTGTSTRRRLSKTTDARSSTN